VSRCPNGHDRDALPRARDGGCRACQRARQIRYRRSPKGREKGNAVNRGEKARRARNAATRAKRVLNEGYRDRSRAKALVRYHERLKHTRRARERAFRAKVRAALPHVTSIEAAIAIYRQMRRAE